MSTSEYGSLESLATQLRQSILDRFVSDAAFRKSVLADPEGALSAAGLSPLLDLIHRLKTADPDAIEAGVQSGEMNPSC